MKDPQDDKSYECDHCGGDGKCPSDRAETEAHYTKNPSERYPKWEDDLEECPECLGEGFIDPDEQEDLRDHYDEMKDLQRIF